MKLKTSLWVAVLAVLASTGILVALREQDDRPVNMPPYSAIGAGKTHLLLGRRTGRGFDIAHVRAVNLYGFQNWWLVDFGEQSAPDHVFTPPTPGPPLCGLTLWTTAFWFRLHLYQFLLLTSLPLLAAVNVGFSLYLRKLGSPAIAAAGA